MSTFNEQELQFLKHRTIWLWKFIEGTGFFTEKVGLEPNATDSEGMTALMRAAGNGIRAEYRYAMNILMRHGWSLHCKDVWNKSPLDYAVRMWNWKLSYDLLQYDLDKDILKNALNHSFSYYENTHECNKFILTLISKLGGISQEKCPKAMEYAYGRRAIPYIVAMANAGFILNPDVYLECFISADEPDDHDGQGIVFTKWQEQIDRFKFRNREDYPLYIENGVLYARPELYKKVWPRLSWKTKKQMWQRNTKMRTLFYVAKKTAGLL